MEPERLVLLALGEETLDQLETGHLDTCEQCRTDMDSLRNVAGLARQTSRLRALPPPPEHVWQRIRTELAASGRDTPPPAVGLFTDPPPTTDISRQNHKANPAVVLPAAPKPTWRRTLAIAAAAALLAASGTALWLRPSGTGTTEAATCRPQDKRIELTALPDAPNGVAGYACLQDVDGQRTLVVHADGMPDQPDGDYEAWLLDRDQPTHMEALGVLGRNGAFNVPAKLDLSRYNIVDISAEPHDGNATHSGHSMLRGTLP
ncbi:anti-sigma factor [Dactylosporangium sp. NPDC051541]|uniref:anti-sigma factor n=1 Tax=Dactylosporangium sp. NPDC051541 TaxID=3363977 RepID=UPI00379CF4F6